MTSRKKLKKKTKKTSKKLAHMVSFWSDRNSFIALGAILIITAITFLPSLQNQFVNWDDDKNFYENPLVVNSTGIKSLISNTKGIFTTPVIGNYNPLSNFSFAVENVLFGLDKPFNFHLDNLLLHLICVFFVFRIALMLGLNLWASVICAILFGIHPMRVESVAWITERKDVLFGSFYLAALFLYIKGIKIQNPHKYLIYILFLFILSGLSKIQAVSLPLSMLAIDYYMDRKLSLKLITEKWMYFMISIGIGILGIYFLSKQGSLETSVEYNLFDRLFVGSFSYIVYLIKLIYPYRLIPLYPYPPQLSTIFYVSMIPAIGVLAFIYYAFIRKWKAIVFGLVFFTFNIVFLLQIVGAGQGFLADRFTYIAYFGLFFALSFYLDKFYNRRKYSKVVNVSIAIYLVLLAYLCFIQNKIWENSGTLWTHVIKFYPNTTLPWGNRANFYRDNGQISRALNDYNKAISLGSKSPQPYNSRAKLYFRSNNRDTILMALQDYTTAISYEPSNAEYYMNRGATYARLQNLSNALQDLQNAGRLDPQNANVYLNRSIVNHQLGRYQDEINDINTYLTLNASNPNMWANRANAKMLLGNWNQALSDINQAITMNPQSGVYHYYRAQYYYNTGNSSAAQQDLNRARQLGFQFNGTIENLKL